MSSTLVSTRAKGLNDPASALIAVVPDDAADLPGGLTRGVYVGGAGLLAVLDAEGRRADLVAPAGSYHPIRVSRILTASTASGIVALY